MSTPLDVNITSLSIAMDRSRLGPWYDASGYLYLFLRDSSSANRVRCLRSADSGQSWAEMDAANRPATAAGRSVEWVATWQDGTTIHVVSLNDTTTADRYDLRYHTFSTSSGTWTSRDLLLDTHFRPTGTTTTKAYVTVRSDGQIVVLYGLLIRVAGTDHASLAYAKNVSGTWTVGTTILAGGSTSDYVPYDAYAGGSGRVHIAFSNLNNASGTADQINFRTLNSSYTSSAQTMFVSTTDVPDPATFTSFTESGTLKLAMATRSTTVSGFSSNLEWVEASDADSPTWTITHTIQNYGITPTYLGGAFAQFYDTTRYAPYLRESVTTDWLYTKNVAGAGWGPVPNPTFQTGSASIGSMRVLTRSRYDNAVVIGYVAQDGTGTRYYRDFILVDGTLTGGWSVGKVRIG